MALSTFTEIETAVAEWLNRTGFSAITDRAEDFIIMGQRRAVRNIRIPPMEKSVTLTFDAEGKTSVPSDYLEAKYMIAEDNNNAWPVQPSTLLEVKKRQVGAQYTRPDSFDVEAGTIYVGAIPAEQSFTLVYYADIPFVTSTNPVNWFSTYAPELILFSALHEAAVFIKDWEAASFYDKKFMQAKQALEEQKTKGEHAGSPLSVRPIR